ncbi:MAG: DUF2336 domain-containing protein [Alphaproteobacteria bacterium]|nr:DUF2336 domain-containing protein [Alphaproteobacteria bacterium]
MSDMGRLAQLAMNPQSGASREEIYLAVASLYRIQGAGLNERERELMREILRRLTRDVEMAIRIALAQRLAEDPTAPHDLILLLVDDTIEVARPLIIKSPLLTESDVLRLIAEAGIGHQEACAGRPHIGVPVTDALVRSEHESVLLALVRNVTAKISNTSYETLVQKSRALTGLQEPLAKRPDLPPQLATNMCEWVSDALKTYIKINYTIAPKNVEAALQDVQIVMQSEPPGPKYPPADSAMKLIEKLAASGQLKAGFLMRVLSQGQVDLFDLAFSKLVGVDLNCFRKGFYDEGARIVAVACRAAGIDRSVFNTVFNLSRQARNLPSNLTSQDSKEVDLVFTTLTRQAAMDELRGALTA